MRFLLLWSLVICSALLFSGCDGERAASPTDSGKASSASSDSGVIIEREVFPSILFEAEGGKVAEPVKMFEDADVSNGAYLLAPEGPDHEEISVGGSADYAVNIPEAGEYVLWVRAKWSGACGNSLGIILDGKDRKTVGDAIYETWHWAPLARQRLMLSAGMHTLCVESREDGSAFDQILLTQDLDDRPSGIADPAAKGRVTLTDCKPPSKPAPPAEAVTPPAE